jgi:hypothetical protein
MGRVIAAVVAATAMSVAIVATPTASASPVLPGPPFVDHVEWAKWGDLSSLRVYPTESGRVSAGQLGTNTEADEAWAEVLKLSPDADIAGMRDQFICHWHLAEFAEPGKTSWNIEPWRPVVGGDEMLAAGCNPGGTLEPF